MIKNAFIAALLLPLLAGCINDGAAFQVDGKEHSISLMREQQWAWDTSIDLFVVATRMPTCQRRHRLNPASIAGLSVELFAVDESNFHLRQGGRIYRIETETCEGFELLKAEPAGGLGNPVGTFRTVDGSFVFVEKPAAPAARVTTP